MLGLVGIWFEEYYLQPFQGDDDLGPGCGERRAEKLFLPCEVQGFLARTRNYKNLGHVMGMPEALPVDSEEILMSPSGALSPRWWTLRIYGKYPLGLWPSVL
jgi:hypothetical protein